DTHIGTIECGPKEDASFEPRDHQLLETLGRQAALAIRNAALASELAERLTEIERQARELAASRTRIVQAEEAGRRRIGRDSRYPAEIEGAAYFLVCEGLANVLKHAAANRIEVRLAALPSSLQVEVADDGRGFEPNEVTGSGLRGLADRVEALGGQLEIISRPGGGTKLIAVLPARETVS